MIDVDRFQSDPAYFGELIQVHSPIVWRVVVDFAADRDHAEDLFQDVWTRAFSRRKAYSPTGSFEGWLETLARNVGIDDSRAAESRAGAMSRLEGLTESDGLGYASFDPFSEIERNRLRNLVRDALAQLTERERLAIQLRAFEDLKPAETAERMGIEVSTVRSIIRHAVRRLKRVIKPDEDELPRHRSSD
jgi:RNA polymerase sigma-70 factor (ECF subfamily)